MMNRIAVLGSTGSIGRQSLSVCEYLGLPVAAISARSNVELLAEQAKKFKPEIVAIEDESLYPALKAEIGGGVKILAGKDASAEAAAYDNSNTVINAIVGVAGLRPALAALKAKKPLALANKESLVAGGLFVTSAAKKNDVPLIPVDSEHSAMFQCMMAGERRDVDKVILTASGGPFFGRTPEQLMDVTVEEALCHPNWRMGKKITIDCATMMNKGLELIEAMWFFGLTPEQVEIVIHRQSALHSAVEYSDGSIIAQLGPLDMRGAIQYALTYPRRLPNGNGRISLTQLGALTFEKPDDKTFICLELCRRAAMLGGLAPCVINGANEQAVELFLAGRISFPQIGSLVQAALESVKTKSPYTLEDVENTDLMAREYVIERYQSQSRL